MRNDLLIIGLFTRKLNFPTLFPYSDSVVRVCTVIFRSDLPALFLPKFTGLQEENRKFTGDLQEISPENTGVYRRLLINTGYLQGIFTEVAILMSEK